MGAAPLAPELQLGMHHFKSPEYAQEVQRWLERHAGNANDQQRLQHLLSILQVSPASCVATAPLPVANSPPAATPHNRIPVRPHTPAGSSRPQSRGGKSPASLKKGALSCTNGAKTERSRPSTPSTLVASGASIPASPQALQMQSRTSQDGCPIGSMKGPSQAQSQGAANRPATPTADAVPGSDTVDSGAMRSGPGFQADRDALTSAPGSPPAHRAGSQQGNAPFTSRCSSPAPLFPQAAAGAKPPKSPSPPGSAPSSKPSTAAHSTAAAPVSPAAAVQHSRPASASAASTPQVASGGTPALEPAAVAPNQPSSSPSSPVGHASAPKAAPTFKLDPTTSNLTFGMQEAYPELYREAVLAGRVQPSPSLTFHSLWGDSLKKGDQTFWRQNLKSMYTDFNQQVYPREFGQDSDTEFLKWAQRGQLYYGDLLVPEAAHHIDQWMEGAPAAEKRDMLALLRNLHATVKPDKFKSITKYMFGAKVPFSSLPSGTLEREFYKSQWMAPDTIARPASAPAVRPQSANAAADRVQTPLFVRPSTATAQRPSMPSRPSTPGRPSTASKAAKRESGPHQLSSTASPRQPLQVQRQDSSHALAQTPAETPRSEAQTLSRPGTPQQAARTAAQRLRLSQQKGAQNGPASTRPGTPAQAQARSSSSAPGPAEETATAAASKPNQNVCTANLADGEAVQPVVQHANVETARFASRPVTPLATAAQQQADKDYWAHKEGAQHAQRAQSARPGGRSKQGASANNRPQSAQQAQQARRQLSEQSRQEIQYIQGAFTEGKPKKAAKLPKDTFKSNVPLKWGGGTVGAAKSTYTAMHGVDMPTLIHRVEKALVHRQSAGKPVEITSPFGTLDPRFDHSGFTVFPVPRMHFQPIITPGEPGRNNPDATHYGRSYRAAEDEEALRHNLEAAAAATAHSKAERSRVTVPLGKNGLQDLPAFMTTYMREYIPRKLDLNSRSEVADGIRKTLNAPTASVGPVMGCWA